MDRDQTLPPSDHEPAEQPRAYRLPQGPANYVGQRIGPYLIHAEIARGGQGVVLRARDESAGRDVALKLLLRPSKKSLMRFRQEGQVLARIQHPNIMRVIDLGEHEGLPYLAMELLDARPLDAELETKGPPPRRWLVEVLAEVALALEHCHGLGLVHRDLKPDNILVERTTGRPIVVDFGLVKRDAERFGELSMDEYTRLSRTGDMQGTPAWMAPEQIMHSKGEISPATDVHALGLILYTLLTGQRPFEGNAFALLRALAMEETPDPRSVDASIPAHLAALCRRALAKSPGDRPTAAEFAAFLSDNRSSRRAPALIGGLLLALVLALGGVAALLWGEPAATAASPPPVAETAPQGMTRAQVREGDRLWNQLKTEREAPARFAGLSDWLQRFPGHPRGEEASAARASARLRFPIARLPLGACKYLAVWGERLITSHRPGTAIHVWELGPDRTLKEVGTWSIDEMRGDLSVLPDGALVLYGSSDTTGTIEIREQLSGEVRRTLEHPSRLGKVHASHDGGLLACVGVDAADERVIRFLDPESGEVRVVAHDLPERVSQLAFSPEDSRLLAGFGSELQAGQMATVNGVVCYEVATGQEVWRQNLLARPGGLCWDASGERVLVGTNSGELIAFDAQTGAELKKFEGVDAASAQFQFMNLVGAHRGTLRLAQHVVGLGYVSVSGDIEPPVGELRVWDPEGGELHRVQGMLGWRNAACAPASRWAALGTADGVVELWALPGFSP